MLCKTCGLELNEGAKFCPGCGQPVELEEQVTPEETAKETVAVEETVEQPVQETPKKKKWLLPVIAGAIALIALLAVLVLGGTGGVSLEEFQNELNYNNGTGVVFDNSKLYFVGDYREDDEDSSVYSTDHNGSNRTLISSDGDIIRLRCLDGELYYEASRGDPEKYEVGILNSESGEQSIIIKTDELVVNYNVYHGKL